MDNRQLGIGLFAYPLLYKSVLGNRHIGTQQ